VPTQNKYTQPSRPGRVRKIMLAVAFAMIGMSVLMPKVDGNAGNRGTELAAGAQNAPLSLYRPSDIASLVWPEWPAYDQAAPETPSPLLPEELRRDTPTWVDVTIKRGQTFSTVVEDLGMPRGDWAAVLALGGDAKRLSRIRAGDTLRFRIADQRLDAMEYPIDPLTTLQVSRTDEGLAARIDTAAVERRQTHAVGQIDSSLFASGLQAGLSNRLIMEMAEIFGYEIDFALELRRGDRFTVLYELLYSNGKYIGEGKILAAEFVNRNRTLEAFRHEADNGDVAYFDRDGDALKTGFRRTPLDVARISSHFNPNRRHPILNTIRAHRGVDYAASSGTPIRSTGDGRVTFVGTKGGYGRTVIVKHGGGIETLYAHMSRYRSGLRSGSRVGQGQIIGYVGASGMATAPHLHYEFRVNGIHKNPVTVALPRAAPLTGRQLANWKPQIAPWMAALSDISRQQVAMRDEQQDPTDN
jgi:murein DD-endopeptidase MepM/ murein hydrolase activator NlpD